MTTNSGTCKIQEKKESKKESKKEDRFNFWIYISLIVLGILLLIIFIYSIYSLLTYKSNNSSNNSSNNFFNNYKYIPDKAAAPPIITTPPVIKTQPSFMSSIFPKSNSTTTIVNATNNFKPPEIKKEINSFTSPLFSRHIIPPTNKQMGGYTKIFKRF